MDQFPMSSMSDHLIPYNTQRWTSCDSFMKCLQHVGFEKWYCRRIRPRYMIQVNQVLAVMLNCSVWMLGIQAPMSKGVVSPDWAAVSLIASHMLFESL